MFLNSNGRTIQAWPCGKSQHVQAIEPWTQPHGMYGSAWDRIREVRKAAAQRASVAESDRLEAAIDESKWILDLREDFFEDPQEPRYSEDTWLRATEFLRKHLQWARESKGVNIEIPKILPGKFGNIKFHWKSPKYELLLTFPADPAKPVTFYGDDYGKGVVKLSFAQSEFDFEPLVFLAKK